MSQNDNLARARADKRELEWVRRRLVETREDRKRVSAQLAISEQARSYEQADVDALTQGIGGFFRRILADHTDLTKEQQELEAAQLVCDELSDELRAIDADIAQLEARERAVANADTRYAEALADVEAQARARGELSEELDALAAAEGELAASRREVHEAMSVGIGVQKAFLAIVNLVRTLKPRTIEQHDDMLGEHLVSALIGRTRETYQELCRTLAHAHQGLRRFEQACQALATSLPPGLDFDLHLDPLPTPDRFVLKDVLWTTGGMMEAILPEISRVSGALSTAVGALGARDATLAKAQSECTRMRASLLDPLVS